MLVPALLAVLAAALQLLTLYAAVKFLLGPCRQPSYANMVLALTVASVTFVLIQAMHLTLRPGWYSPDNVFVYLWGCFHLCNAIVYFVIVKTLERRNQADLYRCALGSV